jgi:hypothetical protein
MGYYADTVVTLHRTGIRSAAEAALTVPLPADGPFPQQLHRIDTGDAGGSKTFTGRVYAGALRVDITQIADWFTHLPWDAYDGAVLTASDGERTLTVAVAHGRAVHVRIENDAPELPAAVSDGPAGNTGT